MRPLVILRPEPGASATARAAIALGLRPLVIPLFEVAPVEWRPPDAEGFDALLLTSANAVRHSGRGLERLKGLAAHCVGEATAAAAFDAGLPVASVGTSGADSLLDSLPRGQRLLHLCGMDRHEPRAHGHAITAVPVYRSAELAAPADLGRIEGSVVAVHSPRSASRLSALARERLALESIAVAAISAEAAAAAGVGWERVEAAPVPSDAALLALASSLCNNA